MPTVSVIIPNYCHAAYLRERIDSVLAQTFDDYEIILLDDCSTDGSRAMIEAYASHPKVSRTILNTENSGSPFKQWRKGIEAATGRYIWIAESDDFAAPTFLERCVEILEDHPNCCVAFTSSWLVNESSQVTRENPPIRRPRNGELHIYPNHTFLHRFLLARCTIYNASMALFRRSALPAEMTCTEYRYSGDWMFWIELVAGGGDAAYLPEPLSYYREHTANISCEAVSTGRRHLETLRILDRSFALLAPSRATQLSIVGKHYGRIRRAAGRQWGQEPWTTVHAAWRERYAHPELCRLWHKIYKRDWSRRKRKR